MPPVKEKCWRCDGTGRENEYGNGKKCHVCSGSGYLEKGSDHASTENDVALPESSQNQATPSLLKTILAGCFFGVIVAIVIAFNYYTEKKLEIDTKAKKAFLTEISGLKAYDALVALEKFKKNNQDNQFTDEIEKIVTQRVESELDDMLKPGKFEYKIGNFKYLAELSKKILELRNGGKIRIFASRYLNWVGNYTITITEIEASHKYPENRKMHLRFKTKVDTAIESRQWDEYSILVNTFESDQAHWNSGWRKLLKGKSRSFKCNPWEYLHLVFRTGTKVSQIGPFYEEKNDEHILLKICPAENKEYLWHCGQKVAKSGDTFENDENYFQVRVHFTVSGPDTFEKLLEEYQGK